MDSAVLEFKEGFSTPYSVIAYAGGYAIANWWFEAGSASLGTDFKVTPGNGTNVRVNPGRQLDILVSTIDDKIAETRETFKFYIEVQSYDAATQQRLDTYINTAYTIVIVDNDTGCFIDLNGDGQKGKVELTFDQTFKALRTSTDRLTDVGSLLNLANQKLEAQQDELKAVQDLARLGAADALVSFLSLGVSNLGKVFARDIPEFLEGIADAGKLATKDEGVGDSVISFIASAVTLLNHTVRSLPVLSLVTNSADQINEQIKLSEQWADVTARIKDTQLQIHDLDTRFTGLTSDIDQLSSCLSARAQAADPASSRAAIQPSSIAAANGGIDTLDFQGIRVVRGSAGSDHLSLNEPFYNLIPTIIVVGGKGNDVVTLTPDLLTDATRVVAGGDGTDTLVIDMDSDRFAYHATLDGVVAMTAFTKEKVWISTGIGTAVESEVPAAGPQLLLDSVERVVFNDRTLTFKASGSPPDVKMGNDAVNKLVGTNGNDDLFGLGGADAIRGLGGDDKLNGGEGNDRLRGNAGADTIDGAEGNDRMYGGTGSDTYRVDSAQDIVVEIAAQGIDSILSRVNYKLAANVENLSLLGDALVARGNALANVLTGNSLDNRLYGLAGNDRLYGQGGDDILFGNAGNDRIVGGAGNDRLFGAAGNDTLHGNMGSDSFCFNTALNATSNVDRVVDFKVAEDVIFLDDAVFTRLAVGPLSPRAFWSGPAAHDASDHVIYDSTTGALLYDADGKGASEAIKFAQFAPRLELTSAHFVVF